MGVFDDGPSDSGNVPLKSTAIDWPLLTKNALVVGVCYIFGRLGFSFVWATCLSLLMVFSIVRHRKHARFHRSLQFQRLMHEPALLQRTLPLIPAWITFPDTEKVDFIGKLLQQMWPSIKVAAENIVLQQVGPIFDQVKPPFLTVLAFSKFDLGPNPPDVLGLKLLEQNESDELMLDIEVEFTGHPNIVVEARSGPASVSTSVGDIFFRSTLRVLLKPLMDEIPCFGALSVSLVSKPEIHFKLSTVGVSVMSIPGLNDFLFNLIKTQLAEFVVWPKKIVVPVKKLPADVLAKLKMTAEPQGMLSVRVVSARDMPTVDCYAKITVGMHSEKTQAKKCHGSVDWNQSFDFQVHDPNNQDVLILIKNDQNLVMGTVNTLVLQHVMNSRADIGETRVPINRVVSSSSNEQDLWLPLQNCSRKGRAPQVHVVLTWEPYTRMSKDVSESRNVPLSRLQSRRSNRISRRGLLSVRVHSAAGLRRPAGAAPHHPYVKMVLGQSKSKTKEKNGPDCVWEEQFEMHVDDSATQVLHVEVHDKHTFPSPFRTAQDDRLGDLELSLDKLISQILEHGSKAETLPLQHAQSGTITLTVDFREQAGM